MPADVFSCATCSPSEREGILECRAGVAFRTRTTVWVAGDKLREHWPVASGPGNSALTLSHLVRQSRSPSPQIGSKFWYASLARGSPLDLSADRGGALTGRPSRRSTVRGEACPAERPCEEWTLTAPLLALVSARSTRFRYRRHRTVSGNDRPSARAHLGLL